MKTLKELLHINEEILLYGNTKWFISFKKPEFQGGDSEEITEREARMLLFFLQDTLLKDNKQKTNI